MINAALSADIISYTSLAEGDRQGLERLLTEYLQQLEGRYKKQKLYSRIVSGDQIECALEHPGPALRISLLLKLKTLLYQPTEPKTDSARAKYFRKNGLRIAVGCAEGITFSRKENRIDGPPIYMSGRAIKKYGTAGKEKATLIETLFYVDTDKKRESHFQATFALLDHLISKSTQKQREVLLMKLEGLSEKEIMKRLGKAQSTISAHSTQGGWPAIEKTLEMFEGEFL